ncbi:MAG TPA: MBL fold metallo-hydrolase, partial [Gammaproteobacteria bacterium]|nr:MBL fold metallo-hydrolase [Gammaproteobacteria bacterium]
MNVATHVRHATRRDLLRHVAALAGAALLPSRLAAQDARLETVRLSPRMNAILGPDATVLAADSDDGVVLVDGGHASWADALLQTVASLYPAKPVRALFNTHWHEEQTGANRVLGERGVEIVAHENTKLWLGKEVWVRWSDKKYPPLPQRALPTTTVYDPGRMT